MQTRNYVISLPNAEKRRNHITHEFSKQHIPFEFFDALRPSPELDRHIEELMPVLRQTRLSPVEQACFMSHLLLWHKCIQEDLPYICIFEDDILLGEQADRFLAADDWLWQRFKPQTQFVLHLETFLMPVKCERQQMIAPYCGREFDILRSKHFGAAGYIISQPSIRYFLHLLAEFDRHQLDSLDELLFNKFLANEGYTAYQLNPALCVQEPQWNKTASQLVSQLEAQRQEYRIRNVQPKPKKTFKQRLIRIKENVYRALIKYKRKPTVHDPSVPFR